MKPFCRVYGGRSRRAAALIIVLAFVALLAVLVLGFLTSSLLNQQISSTSANRSKVDLFADGAVDCIVGDLKQEIADGSTSASYGSYTVYTPKANLSMVPYVALNASITASAVPNLVKMSASGVTPYTGNNYASSGISRASSAQSTTASLNSRYVSLSDWNQALLLPMKTPGSTTDFTPATSTGFATASAPNWILVSKNGSNPTSWSSALEDIPANKSLNASSATAAQVIGRYAYTIYDEGGLLDANVAGYPSTATASQYGYKNAEAYADLTQLPGFSSLSNSQAQTDINQLVGWRNYATAQPSGTFPLYSFSGTTQATNFFNMIVGNASGFLRAANTSLVSNQSDHMFSSRQQLIQFLESVDSANLSSIQTALQYLGTFSRGLSQPSVIKTESVDSTAMGYDATAPKILAANAGGNNGTGLDSAINPSFLSARAKTAFTRNDGSKASINEPLVKKRFNLNRIAWVTCHGPIADDSGNLNTSDTTINTLINTYETSYGISAQLLKQGGPTNIKNYFGLQWDSSNYRWNYVHGRNGTSGPIMKLNYPSDTNDVARAGRDADFFELLKAGINVGALAKPLASPAVTQLNFLQEYNLDTSVDYAVIQIGANIIDQFDPDNLPTRIVFNDGSGPSNLPAGTGVNTAGIGWEFRGVENLPYLYRMRPCVVKLAPPVIAGTLTSASGTKPISTILPTAPYGSATYYTYPANGSSGTGSDGVAYTASTLTITDTGVGAYMIIPEIWNPHDWNSANLNQTQGVVAPTNFRIYAVSDNATVIVGNQGGGGGGNNPSSNAVAAKSPGYSTRGFNFSGETRSLAQNNTEMDFSVPNSATGAALFREPTILFKPNYPTGSNLTAPDLVAGNGSLGFMSGNSVFFNGGLVSAVGDSGNSYGGLPVKNQAYVGFYVNTFPFWWVTGTNLYGIRQANIGGELGLHYYLQCQDPGNSSNWITYDEKYDSVATGQANIADGIIQADASTFMLGSNKFLPIESLMDPRTGRFGLLTDNGLGTGHQFVYPPFNAQNTNGWIDQINGVTMSGRSGTGPGFAPIMNPNSQNIANTAMGWYNTLGSAWSTSLSEPMFRWGYFCQNNPGAPSSDGTPFDQTKVGSSDGMVAGGPYPNEYYADADGVVRRAMGGYNTQTTATATAASAAQAVTATGLPLSTANTNGNTYTSQSASRPMILNRPFRSVAELGYVFSGTPWKNLSFFTPESGYSALLDIFATNDTDNTNALIAGQIDLNSKQPSVLQAILNGAYRDEWNVNTSTTLSTTLAQSIAQDLTSRTASTATGKGPLENVSELVGKWVPGSTTSLGYAGSNAYNGTTAYSGFSNDLTTLLAASSTSDTNIERFREASLRALVNSGQTRVWNLMIDVVAQTGRYPATATGLDNFMVEGQKHYWVHIAIDRYTGQVIDRQVEVVKE